MTLDPPFQDGSPERLRSEVCRTMTRCGGRAKRIFDRLNAIAPVAAAAKSE